MLCLLLSLLGVFWVTQLQGQPPPACFGWPGLDQLSLEEVVEFFVVFEQAMTIGQRELLFKMETPQQVRVSVDVVSTGVQCFAGYSDDVRDVYTLQAPAVRAPPGILTRDNDISTFLCYIHAWVYIDQYDLPGVVPILQGIFDQFGIPFTPLNQDIVDCRNNNPNDNNARNLCYQGVAAANSFCPAVMASVFAQESLDFMENDGWNAYAVQKTLDEPCTANCRNYYDYTEWMQRYRDGELGFGEPPEEPENCGWFCQQWLANQQSDPRNDPDNLWQTLLEDDGLGYFTRQEHVSPQIGQFAVPRSVSRTYVNILTAFVPNPLYDYRLEAEEVVARLNDLFVDYNGQSRKAVIEYMDNKSLVAESFIVAFYLGFQQSFREHLFFQWLINVGKYDAVIMSWTAKLKWSLIRPTTVIQRWDDEEIVTWGGPFQGVDETIKARDFESYVRVMPHSEYPSGSACICEAFKRVSLGYLFFRYGLFELPFPFVSPPIIPGSSSVEPGLTPPGTEPFQLIFPSISEAMYICGQSRLWGGMHFGASVPVAEGLCSTLGRRILFKGAIVLNGYVFPTNLPPPP